jgi:NTE family protein
MRGRRLGATGLLLAVLVACRGAHPQCAAPPTFEVEVPSACLPPPECRPDAAGGSNAARPPCVENLVFEGGGVKGVAYGGALTALDRAGMLSGVRRVAGTSAGAITATLVALGYTADEIRVLMLYVHFDRFEDGGGLGICRLVRRYGLHPGDYFRELMRCLVGRKTGNPDATFADLARRGFRDLHVFATDLGTGAPIAFSPHERADVPVADAVRMSMSVPLVFAAEHFGGGVVVDGGVVENYPIDVFDGPDSGGGTLGFVLVNTGNPRPRRPIRGLLDYSKALIEASLAAQMDDLEANANDLQRTVVLNDLGIGPLDFDVSEGRRRALVEWGIECTCDYLEHWRREGRAISSEARRRGVFPIRHRGRCGWVVAEREAS